MPTEKPPSNELLSGLATVQVMVGIPATAASIPPMLFESTHTETSPIRELDVLFIHDFFDHSGNCINGYLGSMAVVVAGMGIEKAARSEKQHPIAISAAAAVLSAGANVAYEAGVHVPPARDKPEGSAFDVQDAAFGAVTGALYAAVFCATVLHARAKRRRHNNEKNDYSEIDETIL
jgi:hypothetical protein